MAGVRHLIALATGIAAVAISAPGALADPPLNLPTSIVAGVTTSCATLDTGIADCWGRDYIAGTQTAMPTPHAGIAGALRIDAGLRYQCVLILGGTVDCWGDDGYGQLGNGSTVDTGLPVEVQGLIDAIAIATGGEHACALRSTGAVVCWGHNQHGQLGNGTFIDSAIPVTVTGISNATAISAGYLNDDTCAVLHAGRVQCWGANGFGDLGNGLLKDSAVPVEVMGLSGATAIATGGQHTCAVLHSGRIECWGRNVAGELGDGTFTSSLSPVRVVGLRSAVGVAVSGRGDSCAAMRHGRAYCWGNNLKNQLGNGLWPAPSNVPVRVKGVSSALAVSISNAHGCALLLEGAVCWGFDDYGQLGNKFGPALSNAELVLFPVEPLEQEAVEGP
jgi:alpha-tubulin suppressor-like RCC1 family protein